MRKIAGGRAGAIAALDAEGLEVTEWHDDAGASYEEHHHPLAETRIVLDGTMTIVVSGHEHTLGPGDRIDLAPGEPHSAQVGPEGVHYLAATKRSS